MSLLPMAELENSAAPLADAAMQIGGANMRYWVAAGIVIATFGALNGWILILGQIPMAIAEAFRTGNLGIMDYVKYQNVKADTKMRDSIAGGEGEE